MSAFLYPLGRETPPDRLHEDKWPLTAETAPSVPTAVVIGIPWYDSFDNPVPMASDKEGTSYHLPDVEAGADLGSIRGGHCICLEPMGSVKRSTEALRKFYDQKQEGACVGFGTARSQSIMLGEQILFDAFWLYDKARESEGNTGEGSYVRSAFAVLKATGLREQHGNAACVRERNDGPVDPHLGVSAYRWATTVEEVLKALGRENAQAIPFPNNWGDAYPAVTWMPVATLARLLNEEGEAGIATQR